MEPAAAVSPAILMSEQAQAPFVLPDRAPVRKIEVVVAPAKKEQVNYAELSDRDLVKLVKGGQVKFHNLERTLGDLERAVRVRRLVVESKTGQDVQRLPYEHYDYAPVHGQCCENVIGHVPVPVGVAGPLIVNGEEYWVPMATTEGALIASTARGAKAISMSGGTTAAVVRDTMSRAPVLQAPNVRIAAEVKKYIDEHFDELAQGFATTTRFGRLASINCHMAGRNLYIRFSASTGDAMGMNMVGKGVDRALEILTSRFPVNVLALSGNVCTDKKPSAINWIEGRGKSVVVDCTIKGEVVRKVLHTTVQALCETNVAKNLVGSAIAGSIGGNNAHAANIVAATFLATGQDPAQVVESANCMTLMEPANGGEDLYMSITMPSLEVGTVGGGTALAGQNSMLGLLGCAGANHDSPGTNARRLAEIIASTVMAGELSLMSALTSGHLISSHMRLNRKPTLENDPHVTRA
jgi:hydroxymethylglutaryl-CoA reductase (NADPH)